MSETRPIYLRPNASRAFEALVSVDSWHSALQPGGRATVHADVVFKAARLGQEADAPVRFRLSLRRASVSIVIPPNEPLKVIHESVSRDQALKGGKLKRSSSKARKAGTSAAVALELSRRPHLELSAGKTASENLVEEQTFEAEDEVRLILATHSKASDGSHTWELSPASGPTLHGRCWDPVAEPRLSVRDTRLKQQQMEGACRIEVRCKREDLFIEDITLKDTSILKSLALQNSYHNRIAAAESYIRTALMQRGLEFSDVSEIYSDITIANVTVEPKVD